MNEPPRGQPKRGSRPLMRGGLAGLVYGLALTVSIEPLAFWPAALLALPCLMLIAWPVTPSGTATSRVLTRKNTP